MLQPRTMLDSRIRVEAVIRRGGFDHVYRARERLISGAVHECLQGCADRLPERR